MSDSWTATYQASLSITNSWSLLKPMSIESVMPSSHLSLCHSLLLLPSIFPSIRIFSNELVLHFRWPKYWSFSFSISPSNEYSGLISFRMDCLDLLAVQGTLKVSFLITQFKVLWRSAFFILQLWCVSECILRLKVLFTILDLFGSNQFISEKAMATHSNSLAWEIPWMEEPGGQQSMGSWGVRHNWAISLSLLTFMHWRRKWQPTPVFLPGESQGRRSLVGCCLWGCTELDTTDAT